MELRPLGHPASPGIAGPGAAGVSDVGRAGRSGPIAEGQPAIPVRPDAVAVLTGVERDDLERLFQILEPAADQNAFKQLDELVQQLIQRVHVGEISEVSARVSEIAQRAPQIAENLPIRPELVNARQQIEVVLSHLTSVAKSEAEREVAAVNERVPDLHKPVPPWASEPRILLDMCEKMIASGGLTNYRKAERLASSLLPAGTVIADVANLPAIKDARGFRLRVPSRLQFLSGDPALSAVLLLLVLLAASWLIWFR